jgi:hypothetical protein
MTMATNDIWAAWQELMSREDLDPVEILAAAAMYERYFQEVQGHAAQVARAEGRSWQDIADAVGTSKQTAWQKWRGPDRKMRERRGDFGDFPVTPPVGAAEIFDSMVVRIVDDVVGKDAPLHDELLAAGRRALSDAVEEHKHTVKTVPFSVFASWCVRQAVLRRFYELRT